MARLIRFTATEPIKLDPSTLPKDKMVFICACGLSKNLPYCDGSHKPCRVNEQPGLLYVYDDSRTIVTKTIPDQPPD